MQRLIGMLVLGASFCLTSAAESQQVATVAYGRTKIAFSSDFQQTLKNLGASLTDLSLVPFQNGVGIFPVTEGLIDLQSGAGEVMSAGGYTVTAGGQSFNVQNLTIDLTQPTAPTITGVFVINGVVSARQAIFDLQLPPGFSFPMRPQDWVDQITGCRVTLAAAAASTVNGLFGGPVMQTGALVGSADLYAVLSLSGTN